MRKALLTLGIAISTYVLMSCNGAPKNQSEPAEELGTADTIYSTRHSGTNALDFEGVYTGTLPCADCQGLDTEIALNKDMTYVKRTRYIGKDAKIYGVKGTFKFNAEGNIVTLSGINDGPNQYMTGENTLTQLDMAGKKITGNLADKYVLKK